MRQQRQPLLQSGICEQHLALTDWNRRAAYEQMLQRISEAPFVERPNQQASLRAMVQRIVDLRKGTTPSSVREARSVYEEAIRNHPVDFRLYDMPHSVCAEEVHDIAGWLTRVLQ
jgi:hypothetical protein